MSKFLKPAFVALFGATLLMTTAHAGKLDIGREATKAEVAAWDIDVRPDGMGLPEGSGTVAQGEEIWEEKCASCHGDFGEGAGRWPPIAGGAGTLAGEDPLKTIGSYWPYLSTVFDYVNRAMPFTEARSLEPDEVYALTAYIMQMNDLVDEDFELSKANFLEKKLPNEANFFDDPRPDTPLMSEQEPCMQNCKTEVKITGRARNVDVTPEDENNDN